MSNEQPSDDILPVHPGFTYEDNGRTVVLQRLGVQDHTSTVVSAGLMFGYTVTYSVFGVTLDNSLQAYGMSGLSSIHQRYTTNLSYEVGARIFMGVRL
ncbi:MAG: hypothetical protein FGM32_11945 [Candidatus Kapabacteria bacterium]|nr:hypothetical protein [Candidatus Kapabacteria bacterium]